MKLVVVNRKKSLLFFLTLMAIFLFFILFHQYTYQRELATMIMGGSLYNQISDSDNDETEIKYPDAEKYFRPSNLPVQNDREVYRIFDNYFGKKASEIVLPDYLLKTPEDTLINYFSILREAANPAKGKSTGCGSIGNGKAPYPVAYNFLSSSYQKKLPYKKYLQTFDNILHINLIKHKEVPLYDNPTDILRYFVEIETIEGSDKGVGYFAYYYGFADIINESGQYKISDLEFIGEEYLCAPYHSWFYDAEASVQVKYGGWCSLVKEMYPTEQNGFVKNVSFLGTDGSDYLIQFYQLTNDYDIEIAQYKKNEKGNWELIKLDPEKCLKITPSQTAAK